MAALEPRPAGRPRKDPGAAPDVARLQEEVAALRAELQAARARAELATALPRLAGKKL